MSARGASQVGAECDEEFCDFSEKKKKGGERGGYSGFEFDVFIYLIWRCCYILCLGVYGVVNVISFFSPLCAVMVVSMCRYIYAVVDYTMGSRNNLVWWRAQQLLSNSGFSQP